MAAAMDQAGPSYPVNGNSYELNGVNGVNGRLKSPPNGYSEEIQNYIPPPYEIPVNDGWRPFSFAAPDSEDDLPVATQNGNWGNKAVRGAKWVRKGKKVAWDPEREDCEVEERARKRIKRMLPPSRSPSPPTLPHLRSPSPPLVAPYPLPPAHTSFASFVLDPSATHTFRSRLLVDLQEVTQNLIEGELPMRQLLGRLMQSIHKPFNRQEHDAEHVTKYEEPEDGPAGDGMHEREDAPPGAPKLFDYPRELFSTDMPNGNPSAADASHQNSEWLVEKNLGLIVELQEDGREYTERLEEIREELGDIRTQRNLVWKKVREHALRELQEIVPDPPI